MPSSARRRRAMWLGPALAAVLFGASLFVLHRELSAYTYQQIGALVHAVPQARVWLALGATIVGYAMLAGYDLLALAYVGRSLPRRRVAFASFIAYAFSQNVGFAAIAGAAIRYRFWSGWGLSMSEMARGIAFTTATFWIGLLTTAGVALMMTPESGAPFGFATGVLPHVVGATLLVIVALYLAWTTWWRRTIVIREWSLAAPTPSLALAQVAVSALDWALAGTVLYVLLPAGHAVPPAQFLSLFLLAQVAGLVSHAPSGIGVFDAAMVYLLAPHVPATAMAASLVLFRLIYYLLPLAAASVLFAFAELLRRAPGVSQAARQLSRGMPLIAPYAASVLAFVAGVILLVSGATPSIHARVRWLSETIPLGVLEVSHFSASIAGVMLLFLARGLRQRLDAAYHLTVIALVVGIVASLLKGGDYEEAIALGLVFAAVLPARPLFHRRAALTSEPLTPGWWVAVLLAVGGTLWLGLFSYKHVAYSSDLWWRFAFRADAPRFLRAQVGITVVALIVALERLVRPARVTIARPNAEELTRAIACVQRSPNANANLVFIGDKALLFDDDADAFLMYAVEGRSWVALGDPVGSRADRRELAWRFRERAHEHGGWPAFYEVGTSDLSLYLELGLTLLKLGEEARVPLAHFSIDTPQRRNLRHSVRAAVRAGCRFELVSPEVSIALMPELRRVSDAWLELKSTREKGFSLGYFDETYLGRFPLGIVRRDQSIVAFANVLTSAEREEVSVDLMRHDGAAPGGVMDFLLAQLMEWSSREGYRWFNLGMAPLSGFEPRALAPAWTRLGALMYRHGEHFYNFRGLRRYKEKFDPLWEPRYLAAPRGLALPRVLTNIATLVAGGLLGVVTK